MAFRNFGYGGAARGGGAGFGLGTGKVWQKPQTGPNPMKLIGSAPPEAKHENDVVTLAFHNDQLFTGADDGKIKVRPLGTILSLPVSVPGMTHFTPQNYRTTLSAS